MTKTNSILKKFDFLLSLSGILAFLGFVGGFIVFGVKGIAIAPILLPVILFASVYGLGFLIKFIIYIFEPSIENEHKKDQFIMIGICILSAIVLYFVVSVTWDNDLWMELAKEGSTDIFSFFGDLLNYSIDYWKNSLIIIIVIIVLSILLTFMLKFVKHKHINRFSYFIIKLEFVIFLLSLALCLLMPVYYSSFVAKMYCYLVGMFWLLFIPCIKILNNTCSKCFYYKSDIEIIERVHKRVVDHNNYQTIATHDVVIDGEVVYTLKYVAPKINDITINIYKCNNCNKVDKKLLLDLMNVLFE